VCQIILRSRDVQQPQENRPIVPPTDQSASRPRLPVPVCAQAWLQVPPRPAPSLLPYTPKRYSVSPLEASSPSVFLQEHVSGVQLQRIANMAATGQLRRLFSALMGRQLPVFRCHAHGPMVLHAGHSLSSFCSFICGVSVPRGCSTSLQFLVAERLFPGSAMRAVMQKV
jgi:hypothetical protein